MKLLIVEDEAKLADYLRKGLAEEGYVVEVASNGVDGLHMATEGSHDLIVLLLSAGCPRYAPLSAVEAARRTDAGMLAISASMARDRGSGSVAIITAL